jgi:hypothetical protein
MIFKYFKGQIYLIIYLILRKLKLKHLVAYINLVMEFLGCYSSAKDDDSRARQRQLENALPCQDICPKLKGEEKINL